MEIMKNVSGGMPDSPNMDESVPQKPSTSEDNFEPKIEEID